MSLLGILIVFLVFVLIYWAGHKIGGAFSAPPQIMVIFDVVLVILAVIYLLGEIGLAPALRIR